MNISGIHKKIFHADGVLWFLGWIHIFFGFACLCTAPWDYRQQWSTALWLKPAKYAAATVLYAWTIALFLRHLAQPGWAKRLIRWGIFFSMLTATGCLILQAGRGVLAHHDVSTPFDASVLIIMVASLVANAVLALLLMFHLLWQDVDLPAASLGGMVTGLGLFIAGCGVGVYSLMHFLWAANSFQAPPDLRLIHVTLLCGLPVAAGLGHWLSGAEAHRAPSDSPQRARP